MKQLAFIAIIASIGATVNAIAPITLQVGYEYRYATDKFNPLADAYMIIYNGYKESGKQDIVTKDYILNGDSTDDKTLVFTPTSSYGKKLFPAGLTGKAGALWAELNLEEKGGLIPKKGGSGYTVPVPSLTWFNPATATPWRS
ncbi:hypothetical protein M1466_00870 [Candidatus Dependentiae bacterium]|nr:hypothetical protein [Candidatus Dependentiae bacterium]